MAMARAPKTGVETVPWAHRLQLRGQPRIWRTSIPRSLFARNEQPSIRDIRAPGACLSMRALPRSPLGRRIEKGTQYEYKATINNLWRIAACLPTGRGRGAIPGTGAGTARNGRQATMTRSPHPAGRVRESFTTSAGQRRETATAASSRTIPTRRHELGCGACERRYSRGADGFRMRRIQEGNTVRVLPNSVAAPATVSGERPSSGHWSHRSGKVEGMRRPAKPGNLPRRKP